MTFQILCNTYWQAKTSNVHSRDIMIMAVPDMYTCIQLCAQYNQQYSDAIGDDVAVGGGICVSVGLVRGAGQFCHLQNATGINDTSTALGNPVDTAVLTGNWSTLGLADLTAQFGGLLPGRIG
jgi:hypothetical protein